MRGACTARYRSRWHACSLQRPPSMERGVNLFARSALQVYMKSSCRQNGDANDYKGLCGMLRKAYVVTRKYRRPFHSPIQPFIPSFIRRAPCLISSQTRSLYIQARHGKHSEDVFKHPMLIPSYTQTALASRIIFATGGAQHLSFIDKRCATAMIESSFTKACVWLIFRHLSVHFVSSCLPYSPSPRYFTPLPLKRLLQRRHLYRGRMP